MKKGLFLDKLFSEINEGDEFMVRVIGQRYEINDPVISVLAELPKPRPPKKAKLYNKPKHKMSRTRLLSWANRFKYR